MNLPIAMQLLQHSPSFFITFVQFNLGHVTSAHLSSSGIRSSGNDEQSERKAHRKIHIIVNSNTPIIGVTLFILNTNNE